MKKFLDLLISYGFFVIPLFIYELLYILLGYKGNSFTVRSNKNLTDTIPCPYFFLSKIYGIIKKKNIKSMLDLGCGNGRVIDFFNKKKKIKFIGIEFFKDASDICEKRFKNDKNINIINKDFFSYDFHKGGHDCYFINDPLKSTSMHNKLIFKIISAHKKSIRPYYLVFVNVKKTKLKIISDFILLSSFKIGSRGFFIYSSTNTSK